MIKSPFFPAISLFLGSAAIAKTPDVPNLCKASENIVWSCRAARKTFSLCASSDLGANNGYLQYRAGTRHHISFAFPSNLVHPRGKFEYNSYAHGGAGISFKNGAYSYDIREDLKGLAAIWVHSPNAPDKTVQCEDATQSLTLNTTMDLFKTAGMSSVP